jgi:hypothetical protein
VKTKKKKGSKGEGGILIEKALLRIITLKGEIHSKHSRKDEKESEKSINKKKTLKKKEAGELKQRKN